MRILIEARRRHDIDLQYSHSRYSVLAYFVPSISTVFLSHPEISIDPLGNSPAASCPRTQAENYE